MISTEGRTCLGPCGEFKRWEEFSPNGGQGVNGKKSRCKACNAAATRRRLHEDTEYRERHKANAREWSRNNRPHINQRNRERYVPRSQRPTMLWAKFRMTEDEFDSMLADQGFACAVCRCSEPGGQWNTWHVDHDHSCCPGRKSCGQCIRGLLCQECNQGLGKFNDDAGRLERAAAYLRQPRRLRLLSATSPFRIGRPVSA